MTIQQLYEKEIEMEQLEYWCFRNDFEEIPEIGEDAVQHLVKHPPQLCERYKECKSRRVCGEACRCIRGLFEDARQYEEYLTIQKLYIKIRVLEIIFSGVPYMKVKKIQSNQGKNLNNRFNGENNGY